MLGHQPNHVTKEERVENLWKKLIRQETDLSEETIAWMALRIRQLTEYMPYGCALIAYRKQNGEFYMARGTQATGTQATGTQATGTQATGTQATVTQATGTQATGTQATGTQATGTQATVTQAAVLTVCFVPSRI